MLFSPASYDAWKPLFCTELSEKKRRNILLPVETTGEGFLVPQKRPRLGERAPPPS